MSDFEVSTQHNSWLLSRPQLDVIRSKVLQERDNRNIDELPQFLIEEELATQYFCRQILIVFGRLPQTQKILRRKWRVPATATIYFRRFYIYHSFLDYDPRIILLACIFLAGKTEENFIQIKDLQLISNKYTEEQILNAEKVLLDGLQFDLKVHHPQNMVHALLADWKKWKISTHPEQLHTHDEEARRTLSESVIHWTERCEPILHLLLTTISSVTYRPLCLAIYGLLATGHQPAKTEIQEYFEQKFGTEEWGHIKSELFSLRQYGEAMVEANFDSVETFMKRLKQMNRWDIISAERL
eukprot:gene6720-7240_t